MIEILFAGFIAIAPQAPVSVDAYDTYEAVNTNGVTVSAIDLTSVTDIDAMPICEEEDCSDVAAVAQPGLWYDPDSHDTYVTWTDGPSLLIVDDTVR